jgi:chemotaxis protein MotB
MDDKSHDIIIIKRHGGHEEEHHGGAWKIAFADFMTAMMAFFLVLWIINATDKNTKTIIARYFNPLKLEDLTKSNKGIRQVTGDEAKEPQKDDGELTPVQTEPPSKTPNDKKQPAPKDGAKDGPKDGVKDGAKENVKFDTQPVDPAHPKAHIAESTLLEDPYDSLDKIAGKFAPTSGDQEGGGAGATPPPGDADAFIDPFKPMERATTGGGGAPTKAVSPPPAPPPGAAHPEPEAAAPQQPAPPAQPPAADASPHPAPEAKTPNPPPPATPSAPNQPPAAPQAAAQAAANQAAGAPGALDHANVGAAAEAAKLRTELAKDLAAELHGSAGPGVDVQATPEGVLISLTDALNFEMFAIGSAEPQAKVVRIMDKIAQSLKDRAGAIVVRGHTDGRQYRSGTYDNWRLSEARAQMAYYMLVRGGLAEKRVERIEGYADRRLKTPDKPEAAENRRIEILLRKEKP